MQEITLPKPKKNDDNGVVVPPVSPKVAGNADDKSRPSRTQSITPPVDRSNPPSDDNIQQNSLQSVPPVMGGGDPAQMKPPAQGMKIPPRPPRRNNFGAGFGGGYGNSAGGFGSGNANDWGWGGGGDMWGDDGGWGGGGDMWGGQPNNGKKLTPQERTKMIEDVYQQVLGRKADTRDMNYYKYSTLGEEEIRKQLIEGKEHKQLVEEGRDYKKMKDRVEQSETRVKMLEGQIKDQVTEFKHLTQLLSEKNRHIQQLRDRLANPFMTREVRNHYDSPSREVVNSSQSIDKPVSTPSVAPTNDNGGTIMFSNSGGKVVSDSSKNIIDKIRSVVTV